MKVTCMMLVTSRQRNIVQQAYAPIFSFFPTAIPADTGKTAVLNSYVSGPVRLTSTLTEA